MIDNEAAKFTLIKGTTGEATSAWITHQYWKREVELESSSWLERVPSVSNCADGPSRGMKRAVEFLKGGCEVKPLPSSLCDQLLSEWGRLRTELGAQPFSISVKRKKEKGEDACQVSVG